MPSTKGEINVSIIIAANKNRGWLDGAIESALNQDYKGTCEVILASDGNPELERYADKHKIRFVLAEKKNVGATQNAAAGIARGTFLKKLDEDDTLTPNCLTDLVVCIGDHAIAYAKAFNFTPDMKRKFINNPPREVTFKGLRKGNFINGGTVLVRRDVFLDIGGNDEVLATSEDYDFYFNLLSHGYKFVFCDSVVYNYRMHEGRKSHIPGSPSRVKDKQYIYKKYAKWF